MKKHYLLTSTIALLLISNSSCSQNDKKDNDTNSDTDSIYEYIFDEPKEDSCYFDTVIDNTDTHNNSSHSNITNDELSNNPEYVKGGKYDPELYHTDYSKDQEHLRREYIDNDGYDINDDYDEYYGYGNR